MLYICIVNLRRGMSVHHRRRVADIIKGVYCACFGSLKTGNFRNPKQESGKCPLVCLIRCIFTTINISAWAFIVYSCYKVFQYLRVENKQKEVPRFFYNYTNGGLEPTPYKKYKANEKVF